MVVQMKNTKLKKSTKKKQGGVDLKPLSKMTPEEIEAHVNRLRSELERERMDRNRTQIERDKLSTFWTIAKHELEERNAQLRLAQETSEIIAERREQELAAFRLRVRQLQASHASELAEAKIEMETAVGLAKHEAAGKISRTRVLDEALRKEVADHSELVKQMKVDHEKTLQELRQHYEEESEAERQLYMEKVRRLEEQMELRRRVELQATEERKNEQIAVLTRNHEKAFIDMKNYYHSISANNINLIDNLKSRLEEMQKTENRLTKENGELTARNRQLETDLAKSQKTCTSLQRALENHERDVKALQNAKTELKELKKLFSDFKVDNEALLQRLKTVEIERDELYQRFLGAVEEVKQSCGVKNALLEKRMTYLAEELERRRLLRGSGNSNNDDDDLAEAESALELKNREIKNLHCELARLCKAYNDLLTAFKGEMQNFGIPCDNVGFNAPTITLLKRGKIKLGKGPTGLIAVPPV